MISFDFTKMNGAGNDFVMLDNRKGDLRLNQNQIATLCDRHRGIGADGVLILEPGTGQLSIRMRYYNADGREAEMCGNGARCFTRYAAQLLKKESGKISFQTEAGPIEGELLGDRIRILMSIPHSIHLEQSIPLLNQEHIIHSINTGVPHAVIFVTDLEKVPVIAAGKELRHHPRFTPAGTNVNFVQVLSPNSLAIRTYERGVENETLACGTGVVASALVHHLLSKAASPILVLVRGGDTLQVNFVSEEAINKIDQFSQIKEVTLTGPADFIFNGTISL